MHVGMSQRFNLLNKSQDYDLPGTRQHHNQGPLEMWHMNTWTGSSFSNSCRHAHINFGDMYLSSHYSKFMATDTKGSPSASAVCLTSAHSSAKMNHEVIACAGGWAGSARNALRAISWCSSSRTPSKMFVWIRCKCLKTCSGPLKNLLQAWHWNFWSWTFRIFSFAALDVRKYYEVLGQRTHPCWSCWDRCVSTGGFLFMFVLLQDFQKVHVTWLLQSKKLSENVPRPWALDDATPWGGPQSPCPSLVARSRGSVSRVQQPTQMVRCRQTQMEFRARQRLHNSLARSTRPASCSARCKGWQTVVNHNVCWNEQISMKLFLQSPLSHKKSKETTNTPYKTTFI